LFVGESARFSLPRNTNKGECCPLLPSRNTNKGGGEEKGILLKLIETFVSKKRFKEYLQNNIATL